MNMLQQIMTSPGMIEFKEIPMARAKKGEVVVKIMKIGVCGSDIHVYHGKHPFTPYPVTQGHEVSGEIFEIGEGVTGLSIGQKVTIQPQVVCGECHPCRNGKYNLCEELKVMGFQTTGTASEYFAVDAKKITPLPDEMSFDDGAMIEPLAVAVHAVRQAEGVEGKDVVIIGAGTIGILLMQVCKAMGAKTVMVTDISDYRLEKAKECGADYAVNTKNKDFGEAIDKYYGKDKADLIYDCAGSNITMDQAIKHSRKGSTILLVAVFDGLASVDLAVLNDKELNLKSTMMYRNEDYIDSIQLIAEGKINLSNMVSKHFAFRDYEDAYKFIDDNRETALKVIINVQE